MDFFKSIFNETYSIGSEYISKHVDTSSNGIRNHPVFLSLDGLFKSKVDETYSIGSEYISKHVDTNSKGIRNHPVLQDSKVGLGGHSES